MVKDQPIGIFDSGIGGLTVASAIRKALPNEDLIYFGDLAHMPYGDKSKETIERYSDNIVGLLVAKKCKTVVIACNTASALASDFLQKKWGSELLIINVIDPVVSYLKEQSQGKHIGIIGTKGTIGSGVYAQKLHAVLPKVKISSLATPLLASLIEEGYFNNTISFAIIQDYLKMEVLKGIDSLVLACTHYPLIKDQIESILGPKVNVLDSSKIVAHYLQNTLHSRDLLRIRFKGNDSIKGHNEFYVSDLTEAFQKSTELFFGDKIQLKKINLG